MAYSYQDMVSDGSTTQVQVAINFIDRSHLSVLVNGALTAYTWLSPSVNTVVLGSAPTAGSVIRIKRTTPRDKIKYDYSKGSQFSTATVDANNLQLLYIDQEIQDELTAVYGSVSVANLYLGPSATPPTVTPGGLPVSDGMLYYNTTDARIYVKTPDGWRMLTPTSAIAVANTIATAGQTVFNTPAPFTPGTNTVEVWVNGARINIGTDYTESTGGTSITLAAAASVGDEVAIRVIQTLAVGSTSSNLVSYGSSTVKDVLDAISLQDYDALRNYSGTATRFYITGYLVSVAPSGIAGSFVLDPTDSSTADNNATVLVGASGKRYKRQYSGLASVAWFNVKGDGVTPAGTSMQAAINSGLSLWVPDGDYIIDQDLILHDRTFISFDKKAVFKASANNRVFFKSVDHAYFTQIHNPQFHGNGKSNVAAFDLLNVRLNSGIFNPFMTMMDTGIIGRDGCFGLHIQNPTAYAVKNPVVLLANNSGMEIITPNFDNGTLAGGDNSGIGIRIDNGSGSNLGVIVRGGYVQGFVSGVQDAGIGTVLDSTYFESCTDADVSGISGCRNSRYENLQHWGGVGACAYKLRSTDSVTITNPTMGSGARTNMFDVDTSNTNCTGTMPKSNAALNTPLGTITGMLLSNHPQAFTVTDASGASLPITNNTQSILSVADKVITITGDITYPTNSNGSFAAIALPYPALSGTAVNASVGFSNYGSALTLYGTGSSMNVLLASSGAALTNADMSGKRITFTVTYVAA